MRSWVRVVAVLASFAAPARVTAQEPAPLPVMARELADRWRRHDFVGMIGDGRVELRLPGISAAGPVPAEQAVVLLEGYAREAEELEATVTSAMEVTTTSAYVQITRRYRRQGVGEPITGAILLGLERNRLPRGPGEGDREVFGPWRVTVVQVPGSGGR